jgi:protein-tyrosine phosphatase
VKDVALPRTDVDRLITLEGCFNFRDLGRYPAGDGWQVRWRRLFRADGIHRLTAADHELLAPLGLLTVLDLRTREEVDDRGTFDPPAAVARHHLPMLDVLPPREEFPTWVDPVFVATRYLDILGEGRESIAAALRLLCDPSTYPVVFHCSAGRDRTGILSALVLGLLGVPDEVIVADYVLSADAMARMLAWLRQEHPDAGEELDRYAPAILAVVPETMTGFLAGLREKHGSFDGYATDLGLPGAAGSLRTLLLEQPTTVRAP